MFKQQGKIVTFLILMILLVSGLLYYRYLSISRVNDEETIGMVRQQLLLELAGGRLQGALDSLNNGDLQGFTSRTFGVLQHEVVLVDLTASQPFLAFGGRGETIYRVEFNIEEHDQVLGTEVQYLRYEKTLEGPRYRGTATEQAFNRLYLYLGW